MLQAANLTKKYGDFTSLNSLTMQIEGGEVFCLLGANGAGKSTTIDLFLNFIRPTSGSAFIDGLEVTQHALETKSRLTYIPENLVVCP